MKAEKKLHICKALANCWKTINQREYYESFFYFYQNFDRNYNRFVLLEKTRLNTESKLVVIWGLLITCGFFLLEFNENAREPLLTLARHLKTISNVSDGWGEGILGAIGLKKETTSNKYVELCIKFLYFSLILTHLFKPFILGGKL